MILFTHSSLSTQDAIDAVVTENDGAYVLFVGVVRNHARGRHVVALEYEAYAPLAEKQMQKIVDDVQEQWDVKCSILHRLGYLKVGEASVVICVSSSHRADSFEACRWAIDTLKNEVPIWKKEYSDDGTFWIEGEKILDLLHKSLM